MEKRSLFSHVLAPVDGSETSIHAGQISIQLAIVHGANLTFAYVVDSTTVDEIAGATSKSADVIRRDLENKGRRYLDYLSRQATEHNLRAQQIIRQGIPHSEIANMAREHHADLIVIGRVGCRGPRCILIGSVAERVIERAPCPVLVVGQPPAQR